MSFESQLQERKLKFEKQQGQPRSDAPAPMCYKKQNVIEKVLIQLLDVIEAQQAAENEVQGLMADLDFARKQMSRNKLSEAGAKQIVNTILRIRQARINLAEADGTFQEIETELFDAAEDYQKMCDAASKVDYPAQPTGTRKMQGVKLSTVNRSKLGRQNLLLGRLKRERESRERDEKMEETRSALGRMKLKAGRRRRSGSLKNPGRF